MTYVSLAQLKVYCQIPIGTTADDVILQDALDEAQKYIEVATHRLFECAVDTIRYFDVYRDADKYRELYFDTDLCQITTILNGDGTTITAPNYVTNPRNITPWYSILLTLNSNTYLTYNTSPENAIAITGRWAYSITPPADIVHATKRLAKWFYNQRDTSGDIDRPMATTSGIVLLPSAIPNDVVKLIDRYERKLP